MSTTSITPAAVTPSKSLPPSAAAWLLRPLEYWHLLSLDAPTVAVVWAWSFGRAAGISLHAVNLLPLGLATWLLYVIDRLLDGIRSSHLTRLQERHRFHARHRMAFVAAAFPAGVALLWIVIARMPSGSRMEDLVLSAGAGVYLLCVHLVPFRTGAKRTSLLKEPTVAMIFAAACLVPAWSRQPLARPSLLLLGILFAAVCYLNCVGIEIWESRKVSPSLHRVTRRHLGGACPALGLLCAGLAVMFFASGRDTNAVLAFSLATSAGLLFLLDRMEAHILPLRLRAAADAVLLTPPFFLLAMHSALQK